MKRGWRRLWNEYLGWFGVIRLKENPPGFDWPGGFVYSWCKCQAVHDDGQLIQGRFLELGLDGLGDLLGGVGVDVIHAFLDGIERRILISVVAGVGRRFLSK